MNDSEPAVGFSMTPIAVQNGDPDIGRLVAALEYTPFAVTLMANLGKRGRLTAKPLLDDWNKSGTIMNLLEIDMNRSISLSVDSDLVKQDHDAVLLLAILSLLPAGRTRQNLR